MEQRSEEALEAGLEDVRAAPPGVGTLALVVRRPGIGEREVLTMGALSLSEGLVGDTWNARPSRRSTDGGPHPDMQLNVMNARAAALIAGPTERWPLAGDQLYLDLDISESNLPAGTRLAVGDAVIEITDQPHTGCAKFSERFGRDALALVNSPAGRELRLRGANARVVEPGTIRPGDPVTKI